MTVNYTPEMTAELIKEYESNPTRTTVDTLAKKFQKSTKSIIGKLSREGVYKRDVYKSKTGEDPITKLELVEDIADALGTTSENLNGLDKTPKGTLKNIKELLNEP